MSSSLGKAGRHERTEGFPFPHLATISQFTAMGAAHALGSGRGR